jgi:hypothetical protein
MITGVSAFASHFAASASAARSPWGGTDFASFGIFRPSAWIGSSCRSMSATSSTGSHGGVSAILYARTADSAKCCSDIG